MDCLVPLSDRSSVFGNHSHVGKSSRMSVSDVTMNKYCTSPSSSNRNNDGIKSFFMHPTDSDLRFMKKVRKHNGIWQAVASPSSKSDDRIVHILHGKSFPGKKCALPKAAGYQEEFSLRNLKKYDSTAFHVLLKNFLTRIDSEDEEGVIHYTRKLLLFFQAVLPSDFCPYNKCYSLQGCDNEISTLFLSILYYAMHCLSGNQPRMALLIVEFLAALLNRRKSVYGSSISPSLPHVAVVSHPFNEESLLSSLTFALPAVYLKTKQYKRIIHCIEAPFSDASDFDDKKANNSAADLLFPVPGTSDLSLWHIPCWSFAYSLSFFLLIRDEMNVFTDGAQFKVPLYQPKGDGALENKVHSFEMLTGQRALPLTALLANSPRRKISVYRCLVRSLLYFPECLTFLLRAINVPRKRTYSKKSWYNILLRPLFAWSPLQLRKRYLHRGNAAISPQDAPDLITSLIPPIELQQEVWNDPIVLAWLMTCAEIAALAYDYAISSTSPPTLSSFDGEHKILGLAFADYLDVVAEVNTIEMFRNALYSDSLKHAPLQSSRGILSQTVNIDLNRERDGYWMLDQGIFISKEGKEKLVVYRKALQSLVPTDLLKCWWKTLRVDWSKVSELVSDDDHAIYTKFLENQGLSNRVVPNGTIDSVRQLLQPLYQLNYLTSEQDAIQPGQRQNIIDPSENIVSIFFRSLLPWNVVRDRRV